MLCPKCSIVANVLSDIYISVVASPPVPIVYTSSERSCGRRSHPLNIDFMTLTVANPVFRHVLYLLIRNLPSGTFTKCLEEPAGEFQFVVVDRVGHVLVDPFGYIGVEIL